VWEGVVWRGFHDVLPKRDHSHLVDKKLRHVVSTLNRFCWYKRNICAMATLLTCWSSTYTKLFHCPQMALLGCKRQCQIWKRDDEIWLPLPFAQGVWFVKKTCKFCAFFELVNCSFCSLYLYGSNFSKIFLHYHMNLQMRPCGWTVFLLFLKQRAGREEIVKRINYWSFIGSVVKVAQPLLEEHCEVSSLRDSTSTSTDWKQMVSSGVHR